MGNTIRKEGTPTELALAVTERLKRMHGNKAELAIIIGCSRSMVSQYLSGTYWSNPKTIEAALRKWMDETEAEYGDGTGRRWSDGAAGEATEVPEAVQTPEIGQAAHPAQTEGTVQAAEPGQPEGAGRLPEKVRYFESDDYRKVIALCQSCQEDRGLGIVVGRSGYGKTHALQRYAQLPRVCYLECDDTMSSKDMLEEIEEHLGLLAEGGTIHRRVKRIREFLRVNTGYLMIFDEADKLMNKYTTAKLEIIRGIFDKVGVGIVIAGEPRLETDLKQHLARFSNRVDFYHKMHGLCASELDAYLAGWDITEDAAAELAQRAFAARGGCFRLLDRTLNNVLRVLRERGETKVTAAVVREASGMMML